MDQRGHKMLEICGRLDAHQRLDAGNAGALVNDGSRLTDASQRLTDNNMARPDKSECLRQEKIGKGQESRFS
jgi:hypothetical protein